MAMNALLNNSSLLAIVARMAADTPISPGQGNGEELTPPPMMEKARKAKEKLDKPEAASAEASASHPTTEQLDTDEEEYRRMRRDIPHVAGAAAAGLLALGVSKTPDKNDFFRTKKGFCPVFDMVSLVAGMEHKFFAVDAKMLDPLASIGIRTAPHVLYLTITTQGVLRVIPVRCVDEAGERNEYSSTKEAALLLAMDVWVRLYSDVKQGNYRGYQAAPDRFPDPVWPEISEAKVFRLAFRDRGCLIDSVDHPRFAAWAALPPKTQKS
jgi:hypothetical protein